MTTAARGIPRPPCQWGQELAISSPFVFPRDHLVTRPTQLDEYRRVVRDLIPDRFVGLAVGHMAERRAIHSGHYPPVDDDVVNKFGNVLSRQLMGMSRVNVIRSGCAGSLTSRRPCVGLAAPGPTAVALIPPCIVGTHSVDLACASIAVVPTLVAVPLGLAPSAQQE